MSKREIGKGRERKGLKGTGILKGEETQENPERQTGRKPESKGLQHRRRGGHCNVRNSGSNFLLLFSPLFIFLLKVPRRVVAFIVGVEWCNMSRNNALHMLENLL